MFVWTIGDAVAVVGIAVIGTIAGVNGLVTWVKQKRCKHDGHVHETMACNAICMKCGKDLGFIGTWREKQKSLAAKDKND